MRGSRIKQITDRYGVWVKWGVAGLILWYLFTRIDADSFLEAIRMCRFGVYLPLAAGFVVVWFLIESQNLSLLFRLFGHRVPFKDMRIARGATYLMMIINYNLGLGGIAIYLKNKNGIPLARTSSIMLFYYFVESVGITFFAAAGCFLIMNSGEIYIKIALTATLLCTTYLLVFTFYRIYSGNGLSETLSNSMVLASFREATFAGYLKLTVSRAIYFASFILFFYFGLKSFHVSVPLLTLVALVPVIFFLGNIPVTPFGLGTIQAAMLFFFKDFGPTENILAFSIVYSTTLILLRAPIGILYMWASPGKGGAHHAAA